MSNSKLAILIPIWGDRPEFKDVLSSNISLFGQVAGHVIICTDRSTWNRVGPWVRALPVSSEISVVVMEDFQVTKGRLLNLGFYSSRSLLILCADCDIRFSFDALQSLTCAALEGKVAHIAQVFCYSNPRAVFAGSVDALRTSLSVIMSDGRNVTVERSSLFPNTGARGGPGIVCMEREIYARAFGFNGDLIGYGWEDVDFVIRATLSSATVPAAVGRVEECRESISRAILDSRLLSESQNYQTCVANYCIGELRGTLESDCELPHTIYELNSIK